MRIGLVRHFEVNCLHKYLLSSDKFEKLVDYAPTSDLVQEAQNGKSRAGTQPIIIKAIGLKDNNHSIIISTTDAEKILTANQSINFLNKCAVVVLN